MKKINFKCLAVLLLSSASYTSYSQNISVVAGTGADGSCPPCSGNGGPATAAQIWAPTGVAVDANGNIYIAEEFNACIQKVTASSGIITVVAGQGAGGLTANGIAATDAKLSQPSGVALDALGNIYIADQGTSLIREVTVSSGLINTIGGGGVSIADEVLQPPQPQLSFPDGLTLDGSGNIYFSDQGTNLVREITASSGTINTIAGGGSLLGDGGPATAAQLNAPFGVALDASNNLYISDQYNNRIRMVNTSGTINTFAGNGIAAYSGDGGQATAAEISLPWGVAVDSHGNVYIGDWANYAVRIVNSSGIISTFAGDNMEDNNTFFGNGGPAAAAELNEPAGIAFDASGNTYIADYSDEAVRMVTATTTEVSKISSASNEVNTYPIPNNGYFTVTGLMQGQAVELYNYLGKKIATQYVASVQSTMRFDIAANADGIYLIRVLNRDGSIVTTSKVIKTE